MRVDKTYSGTETTEIANENPQLNQDDLFERLEFETLLSDLAVAFIQIPITEIDYEINDWLKRVSEFFVCDIIRLFEQFPIDNSMNMIYTYSKPGVNPPAHSSSINYPWVAAQILEGNPCILHSLEDIPEDAIDDRNSFIDRGLKSMIGVPLISGDNVIGGFSISSVNIERQWTSIEIERVQRIGNVFANIIVRKGTENLLNIQKDLAIAISTTRDLDEGLRFCVEAALNAAGMDCGGVYLVDTDSGALDLVFHKGLPPEFVKSALHYDADSANAQLIIAGKPIYSRHRELVVSLDRIRRDEGLSAIAVIPIQYRNQVIGCLNIASHIFDEVPIYARNALEMMAAQIGGAIVRLRAEQALRESEERYKTLFEGSSEGIAIADIETKKFRYANPVFCKMLGYSNEEIIQMEVIDIHPKDRLDFVVHEFEAQARGEKNLTQNIPCLHKDGSIIYADFCTSPIIMDGIECNVGFVTDITDRKRAEEELRESEERLSTILDKSPIPTAVGGFDGSIISFNEALEEIIGYKREEIKDIREWENKLYPDEGYREFVHANINQALEGKKQECTEFTITCKDGSKKDVDFNTSFYTDGLIIQMVDITERKRAEEAMLNEKLLSEEYINSLPGLFYVFDEQRFVKWNSSEWRRITGYSDEELAGKYGTDFFEGDDKKHIAERMQKTFSEGFADAEAELVTKDGSRIPYFFTGLRKKLNGKDHLVGLGVDITERKQAEETLRGYEHIVSSSNDMLALLDRNFVFLATNETYAKTFGKTRNELIGSTVSEIFGNKFFETVIKSNAEKCLQGNEVRYQNWFDFPALGKRYMEITYDPYRGSDNEIKGFVVNGRDITERKKLEEERDRILNLSPDLICIASTDGYFKYLNPAWEEIVGYTLDELYSKPFMEFIHPDDHSINNKEVEKLSGGIPTEDFQNRYIHKDGSVRIIQWKASPIQEAGLMYCIGRDITESKKMEEELSKQSKLESLGILAAGIAHDYNNILVVLMGNISLSKEFCDGDEDLLQSLEDAEKACDRAKDLTHQLYTFARGGAPIKRTLNIVKLLKDTTSFTLRGSNVNYEISCASAEINMLIDEGQISQVINNIVLNARQAMPNGGKIELRIEERELEQDDKRKINAGKHIKIEIEDKGDGIPENILNKIFDPFFTTKEKGTGLGLATSYSIIKNHQGCIFVTSKKGRGTKFTIYLPMTKVVKEETVSEKLSDFKGDGRILVIDDEEAIRLLLKRILTMSGYEVETVSCSEEGFALYREGIIKDNRFSAVIIDLTLPGDESGDKVLKRIKSVDPDVKAIVSSGYSNDPIMANYCDYGFSGILTKPYKADIVRKTLYFILQD